jgi:hypothetical protein
VRVCRATKVNGERWKGLVGAASDYCPADVAVREGASKAARGKPEAQLKGV